MITQQLIEWDGLRMNLLFCYQGPVSLHGSGLRGMPGATAWLIEQGWAKVTDADGKRLSARAGQWLFVRPGVREQAFSKNVQMVSINFRAAFHTGENLFDKGLSLVMDKEKHPPLEKRARELVRVGSKVMGKEGLRMATMAPVDLKEYMLINAALSNWIMEWSESLIKAGLAPMLAQTADRRIKEAVSFMQEKLTDPTLDGQQIAREVGLSLKQLNRQFVRERGETLRQCHQAQRREHAQHLLMRSGLSIKEIASELGFRYQSHFASWFRKQTGMTPSAFRKTPALSRFFYDPAKIKRKNS